MYNQNVHLFCPEFLVICQESSHSASDAMSNCLLAKSTWLHKVPSNTKICSSSSYNISNSNLLAAARFIFEFTIFFLLLKSLINHVVFPRIAKKFRTTGTF